MSRRLLRKDRFSAGAHMSSRSFMEYTPRLAAGLLFDATALVLGRVTLAEDVSVWPITAIRGDVHDITIGARTNIQDGSVVHNTSPESLPPDSFPLVVGEDVTVGHKVVLHGCRIGNRVL